MHRYRATCAWTTLLAATGFKVDVPRRELTIAPVIRVREVRAPFVDHVLLERMATLEGSLKMTGVRGKQVLRAVARDLVPRSRNRSASRGPMRLVSST